MKYEVYNLPEIIGEGYGTIFNFRGRYIANKGGRASKKSKTYAIRDVNNIMEFPDSNMLVIRKTGNTLRTSCLSDIEWAINRLGVQNYWKITTSPMQATYTPTGQKIIFRGMDDPLKLTSISVPVGHLCWMRIEEAYEVFDEGAFNKLDLSIRGKLPDHLWKQITLSFNPWNDTHWIYTRFFKQFEKDNFEKLLTGIQIHGKTDDILAVTTNYLKNEFLDEADLKVYNLMKIENPERWKVEGLGFWGVIEGVVFDNWRSEWFNISDIEYRAEYVKAGMDYGWTDPNTFICGSIVGKNLYLYNEYYKSRRTGNDLVIELEEHKDRYQIVGDNADQSKINDLDRGGYDIEGAKKGAGSVKAGISTMKNYNIIIHPNCINTIIEFNLYSYKKNPVTGKFMDEPIDMHNHIIDPIRYLLEEITFNGRKSTGII